QAPYSQCRFKPASASILRLYLMRGKGMSRLFKQLHTGGLLAFGILILLSGCALHSTGAAQKSPLRPGQRQEIVLHADKPYANYYTDVDMWVQLKGPDFDKRVYGFWDGDNRYVVRVVATQPGQWSWRSGSNHPDDTGLNGHSGAFTAVAWSD